MKRWEIGVSMGCVLALAAALVPAMASGANIPTPAGADYSADERKKPKPTRTPKPTKSPKPSKSPQPTPTPSAPVPIQAKIVGAWADRQWAGLDEEPPRFTYLVEPVLQGSHWEAALVAGAEEAFAIHRAIGYPASRDYRVYMGWNRQWLTENMPPGVCSGANSTVAQCWDTNIIMANFSAYARDEPTYTPQSFPLARNRIHIGGHLGHELAHMVQEEISPRYKERMRTADSFWLVEGWAMMIELITGAKVYDLSYTDARDNKLQAMGWRCTDTHLRDLLYKQSPQACEYLKGMLAMEYLMWKSGDMTAGLTYMLQDSPTPQDAFKRAFSMDLDLFMEEANRYADHEISLQSVRKPPFSERR